MQSRGNWIQTYTGKRFYPLDPRPEDIEIVDIAHSLSRKTRFNGHASRHYSVAEHSILVAYHVSLDDPDPRVVLAALLHDASEAYLSDVPRPIKMLDEMAPYRAVEEKVERLIAAKYGLPWPMPDIVKIHDDRALATEFRELVAVKSTPWGLNAEPWEDMPEKSMSDPTSSLETIFQSPRYIRLFHMERIKHLFLAMARVLTGDTSVAVDDWHVEDAILALRNVRL